MRGSAIIYSALFIAAVLSTPIPNDGIEAVASLGRRGLPASTEAPDPASHTGISGNTATKLYRRSPVPSGKGKEPEKQQPQRSPNDGDDKKSQNGQLHNVSQRIQRIARAQSRERSSSTNNRHEEVSGDIPPVSAIPPEQASSSAGPSTAGFQNTPPQPSFRQKLKQTASMKNIRKAMNMEREKKSKEGEGAKNTPPLQSPHQDLGGAGPSTTGFQNTPPQPSFKNKLKKAASMNLREVWSRASVSNNEEGQVAKNTPPVPPLPQNFLPGGADSWTTGFQNTPPQPSFKNKLKKAASMNLRGVWSKASVSNNEEGQVAKNTPPVPPLPQNFLPGGADSWAAGFQNHPTKIDQPVAVGGVSSASGFGMPYIPDTSNAGPSSMGSTGGPSNWGASTRPLSTGQSSILTTSSGQSQGFIPLSAPPFYSTGRDNQPNYLNDLQGLRGQQAMHQDQQSSDDDALTQKASSVASAENDSDFPDEYISFDGTRYPRSRTASLQSSSPSAKSATSGTSAKKNGGEGSGDEAAR